MLPTMLLSSAKSQKKCRWTLSVELTLTPSWVPRDTDALCPWLPLTGNITISHLHMEQFELLLPAGPIQLPCILWIYWGLAKSQVGALRTHALCWMTNQTAWANVHKIGIWQTISADISSLEIRCRKWLMNLIIFIIMNLSTKGCIGIACRSGHSFLTAIKPETKYTCQGSTGALGSWGKGRRELGSGLHKRTWWTLQVNGWGIIY